MPAKSAAQYRLMAGVAHGMKPYNKGLSPAVAKKFVSETPASKRSAWSKKKKLKVK